MTGRRSPNPALAIRAPLNPQETPASLVSRLSARHGLPPREFCSDLGLHWPSTCSAHLDQLHTIALLTGLPAEALTFWSVPLVAPCRYRIGRVTTSNGALHRTVTRICPLCARDSVQKSGWTGIWQAADWLIECLHTCGRHKVPLLRLPNAGHAHHTYDVVARVRLHWDQVLSAAQVKVGSRETPFEAYIRHRILEGPQPDWLAALDITQISGACLSLGKEIAFGRGRKLTELAPEEQRRARQRGFEVFSAGADAVGETIASFKGRAQGARSYLTTDLGEFYDWMRNTRAQPELHDLRRTVLHKAQRLYPLTPGRKFFGLAVETQDLVTLDRAWRQTGIGRVRIRDSLAWLDGLSQENALKIRDITQTDLDRVCALWEEICNLNDTAKLLQVHPAQIKPMIENGVLEAITMGSTLRYVWKSSIDALLDRVNALPQAEHTKDALTLADYCCRNQVHLGRLLREWQAGDVTGLARRINMQGLQQIIVVGTPAVTRQTRSLNKDLPLTDCARFLRTSKRQIQALRALEILTTRACRNPDTNHLQLHITQTSLQTFLKHYVTLGQLAHQHGIAPWPFARKLDRLGIPSIKGKDGTRLRVYSLADTKCM